MIRINRHIVLLSGVMCMAGISLLIFLQKLPQLASHAVYYCQSNVLSFLTPIPRQFFMLPFILLSLFATYALMKLFLMVIQSHRLRQNLIKHTLADKSINSLLKRLKIKDKTYVIKNDKPFAICLGIFSPKIYISTGLLDLVTKGELEIILRHEMYHLANKDSLTMVLASFTMTLLPFLPVLTDFIRNYRVDRELKADMEAVTHKSNKYLLISVLKKLLQAPSASLVFAPAILEHDTLEPRIAAITNNSTSEFKQFKMKNVIITFIFLATISFIAVGPVHAMHIHSDNSHLIMLHSPEDECLSWGENIGVHP